MSAQGEDVLAAITRWADKAGVRLSSIDRILKGVNLQAEQRVLSLETGQAPSIYIPGLRAMAFWARDEFGWIGSLEAAADRIRAEMLEARPASGASRGGEFYRTDRGEWTVRFLTCIGRRDEATRAQFPETVKALASAPGALTCGMTYFSAIAAGTHILPHAGFTNAHLRCHLALTTPEGCRIRVGDETRSWVNGQVLVFDDTYEHEVWNDSEATRVVLLFDIYHPDLTTDECDALEFLAARWRRTVIARGLTDARQESQAATA